MIGWRWMVMTGEKRQWIERYMEQRRNQIEGSDPR